MHFTEKFGKRFWVFKVLPSLVTILVFLLIVQYAKQHSPNRDDLKLKELQQLAAETKVFPGFLEIASSSSSRAIDAGVYKSYRSSADFERVREFYRDTLNQNGWRLSQEKVRQSPSGDYDGSELVFQKKDLQIVIEYTGNDLSSAQWNYSVNFVWRSQS